MTEQTVVTEKRAVILLSGGLDSATVVAMARAEGYSCYTMSFDYGQNGGFTGGNGKTGFNGGGSRYANEDEFEARQAHGVVEQIRHGCISCKKVEWMWGRGLIGSQSCPAPALRSPRQRQRPTAPAPGCAPGTVLP